jgi:hypothetical protein
VQYSNFCAFDYNKFVHLVGELTVLIKFICWSLVHFIFTCCRPRYTVRMLNTSHFAGLGTLYAPLVTFHRPRYTVRMLNTSHFAGLGTLYAPLVIHIASASVHRTDA